MKNQKSSLGVTCQTNEEKTVIFIGGYGRSGSTLLGRLLGQVDGVFSLGEMHHVWERSFHENQLCGCGKPFRECPFWNEVVTDAFGGFRQVDLERVQALRQCVDRIRYAPLLAIPKLRTSGFSSCLLEYIEIITKIYLSIFNVSDSNVVVDSSKDFLQGAILLNMPKVGVHYIQLIRDSRAVAHSWTRRRERPEVRGQTAFMPRYSVVRSSLEWNYKNIATELFRSMAKSNQVIKYEEIVKDTSAAIQSITRNVFSKGRLPESLHGQKVNLGVNHTVSGNPMRFKTGEIEIRNDDKWKQQMNKMKRNIVKFLTWPLLKRFGYI
jgi:hypothetical protein